MGFITNAGTLVFIILTTLSALPVYTIPTPLPKSSGKVFEKVRQDEILEKRNTDVEDGLANASRIVIPPLDIKNITATYGGAGCSDLGSMVMAFHNPDTKTVEVKFMNYFGNVDSTLPNAKFICNVNVFMEVTKGWTMTISSMQGKGYVNLDAGVSAHVKTLIAMDNPHTARAYQSNIDDGAGSPMKDMFTFTHTTKATYSCPSDFSDLISGTPVTYIPHTLMMTNIAEMDTKGREAKGYFGRSSLDRNALLYDFVLTFGYEMSSCDPSIQSSTTQSTAAPTPSQSAVNGTQSQAETNVTQSAVNNTQSAENDTAFR